MAAPCLPDGFQSLLEAFVMEALRQQPENVLEFGALYFEEMIAERQRTGINDFEKLGHLIHKRCCEMQFKRDGNGDGLEQQDTSTLTTGIESEAPETENASENLLQEPSDKQNQLDSGDHVDSQPNLDYAGGSSQSITPEDHPELVLQETITSSTTDVIVPEPEAVITQHEQETTGAIAQDQPLTGEQEQQDDVQNEEKHLSTSDEVAQEHHPHATATERTSSVASHHEQPTADTEQQQDASAPNDNPAQTTLTDQQLTETLQDSSPVNEDNGTAVPQNEQSSDSTPGEILLQPQTDQQPESTVEQDALQATQKLEPESEHEQPAVPEAGPSAQTEQPTDNGQ